MKRSSIIMLSFSSAAWIVGLCGAVTPSARTTAKPAASAATLVNNNGMMGLPGMSGMPVSAASVTGEPLLPLTPLARTETTNRRYDILDLQTLSTGDGFEPMSLNNRGDVLGMVLSGGTASEGPGLGYLSNRIQMIAGQEWRLFRNNSFVPLVGPAPEGYLYTASLNDRGQVLLMHGPRGRRGRIEPQAGEVRFALWENGAVKPLPIADDVRRNMQSEATTGMLALNDRLQVILSMGRTTLTWDKGKVAPLRIRHIQGFNNQGLVMGAPYLPPISEAAPSMVSPSIVAFGIGQTDLSPMPRQFDVVFDLNDRGQALCSFRRASVGAERDRFFLLSAGKATPVANVAGAITARLNNQGQAVLGRYLHENGKIYDLESLVPSGSPWKFQYVLDINDRGEILMRAFNVVTRIPRSVLLRPRLLVQTAKASKPKKERLVHRRLTAD